MFNICFRCSIFISLFYYYKMLLLSLLLTSIISIININALYETNFNFYLGIDGISINIFQFTEGILELPISLICFIPVLVLIITLLASTSGVNTETDSRAIMKDRVQDPRVRSDIVWVRTPDNKIFIYDQYDSTGSTPIEMFIFYGGIRPLNIDGRFHRGITIDSLYVYNNHSIMPTVQPAFHIGNRVITTKLIPL